MKIYTMPDDDTTSQIANWASAKYGNAAPALTSYAAREGGYSDPLSNAAGLSAPATVTATPSWASAAAGPAPAIPVPTGSWSAFQAPEAPTVNTTQIDPSKLATRTVDPGRETVSGQINSLLSENSPVLQQARNDALRTANDRGMLNSTLAASGGTDAVIRSAAQIGSQDATTWGNAADYNTALKNQSTMWNADQTNQNARANAQLQADAASRAQSLELAKMQDATNHWQQEMQNVSSRYNTDLAYRKDVDNQKLGVANNIIANMDLSPDRKAAMLEQLGFGTMQRDGQPGTGLAGAVYVIGSTSNDLNFSRGQEATFDTKAYLSGNPW
jgi:hypothetical protein